MVSTVNAGVAVVSPVRAPLVEARLTEVLPVIVAPAPVVMAPLPLLVAVRIAALADPVNVMVPLFALVVNPIEPLAFKLLVPTVRFRSVFTKTFVNEAPPLGPFTVSPKPEALVLVMGSAPVPTLPVVLKLRIGVAVSIVPVKSPLVELREIDVVPVKVPAVFAIPPLPLALSSIVAALITTAPKLKEPLLPVVRAKSPLAVKAVLTVSAEPVVKLREVKGAAAERVLADDVKLSTAAVDPTVSVRVSAGVLTAKVPLISPPILPVPDTRVTAEPVTEPAV